MTTSSADTEQVDLVELDRRLYAHPSFGDDDLIVTRAHGRLRLILDFVIDRSAALTERRCRMTSDAVLDLMVEHPVVKLKLEDEARRWHYDGAAAAGETPADVEATLLRALDLSETRPDGYHAGPLLLHGPGSAKDPLAADLEEACEQFFVQNPDAHGRFLHIDTRHAQQVRDAMRLAGELLPVTAGSVMRHIRGIALIDAMKGEGRLLSASGGDQLPGTIILHPGELSNVWHAAGRLLHEALHLKLFEISRCTSIVADPVGMTTIPWRISPWEARRVFAAFHVYAHLRVFHWAIEVRGPELASRYGEPPENAGVSRSTANQQIAELGTPTGRGTWLGRQLHGPLRSKLTRDGSEMLRWLIATVRPVLDVLGDDRAEPTSPRSEPVSGTVGSGFRQARDVWRREVGPAATLHLLNPLDRSVHSLNLEGWLVFDLCDGSGWPDLLSTYTEVTAGKIPVGSAEARLGSALRELQRVGLVTAS